VRNLVPLRAALLALALVGLLARPAAAHTGLSGSDPAAGSTLSTAPADATLTFTENVGNGQLAVRAPDGSAVAVSDVRTIDNTLTGTVADVDQRGTYSLSYRVVSADGHPVTGTLTYDVTAGRSVTQVKAADEGSFVHRHRSHFIWGVAAAVVAIALLLAPSRRRHDTDPA
jgi:methionine-rich copper-binding protein CopC